MRRSERENIRRECGQKKRKKSTIFSSSFSILMNFREVVRFFICESFVVRAAAR